MQSTPGYAESQIRLLLKDLADSNNSTRLKAVQKFRDYVERIRPEFYDDDVEYLFSGGHGNGRMPNGLLYYAGQSSTKHEGQLKRIASTVIELILWLITFDMNSDPNDNNNDYNDNNDNDDGANIYDNIFYDQFICLPIDSLILVHFHKHILNGGASKGSSDAGDRGGNQDAALELISILLRDHRDEDGEYNPINSNIFLNNNQYCKDQLTAYLGKTNAGKYKYKYKYKF
jgi:hypothetical protein